MISKMEKILYKGLIFTNPDYDERNLNRGKTMTAIKKNIIVRKPCEICNDKLYESDAHHEKYSDYLNVRWLCRPHHKLIHSLFNKINTAEHNLKVVKELHIKRPNNIGYGIDIESYEKTVKEFYDKYSIPDEEQNNS